MRALVSGGAGQIGSHLVISLLKSGHQVVCIDNLCTGDVRNLAGPERSDSFSFIQANVSRPIELHGHFDAIYHLASPASPPEYVTIPLETLAVNSIGTSNLLRVAAQHKSRFVFASTSEVYGDPTVHPQTEDYWGNVNPVGPRSCYDESKRFGEALTMAFVRKENVDGRIVRIFNTYGPNSRMQDGRMVPNFITQALRNEPLTVYGSGDQTRSLCYVTDTVRGIRSALESDLPAGEVINIGNPEEFSVLDFAHEISRACGREPEVVYQEMPVDDPRRRCPDISKARRLLGWQPEVSLQEGLQKTVEWFVHRLSELAAAEPASRIIDRARGA